MILMTCQAKKTEDDPRWTSVVKRDSSADACFVYGVKTTGIYCRPSCPARRASPENVTFHSTCRQAELAGFRACKRCHPNAASVDEQLAAKVAQVCRFLDAAVDTPSLQSLAESVELSPSHLHRSFKRLTGLTPKGYAEAGRAARLREGLAGSGSVTEAIYGAGYSSSSRFYERASEVIGMKPSDYRKGGDQARIEYAVAQCSLGVLLVARSQRGLCSISLGDRPEPLVEELFGRFPQARLEGEDHDFAAAVAQVVRFVEEPALGLDLPLDIQGTAFQQRVWQALRGIPSGQQLSYSQLAELLGEPKAVRAVASACAANTLAVAIPCHRIVRKDGSFTGYRWGIDRKKQLLKMESAQQT